MCGIAGMIGKKGKSIPETIIQKMTDKIVHRGPDAEGVFCEKNVGLGHRRLSILDLSESGNQPMTSKDGRLVIVFNGEIYNYIELKEELKKEGCAFQTETDTEVIMEAYRRWGDDCTKRFNGMWSIVIYDREVERVFLSRDRFGVKPLYILDNSDYFAFSSEIKCLTEIFPEEKTPDIVQVARYMRWVQEDSDERTFYENIKSFPKAQNLTYHLKNGEMNYKTYWEVNVEAFQKKWKTRHPVRLCRELLEDAIRIRLRSDVPVGASLSGGLDSSAIVEIVKKKHRKTMHTFSARYEGKGYDEQEFIDCINEDANAIAHSIFPEQSIDKLEDFEKMLYYHDGPLCFASPYSGFCVYRGVENTVKVMLDGQGADELFAGYLFLVDHYVNSLLQKGGFLRRTKAIGETARIHSIWAEQGILSDETLLEILGPRLLKRHKKNKRKNSWLAPRELFRSNILSVDLHNNYKDEGRITDSFQRVLYHEQFHGILPRILHDVDRNSMAFSLEVRLPFLDYRLVEFSYALSSNQKYHNGWTKYLLRKAIKPYLPKKIWSRRQKLGFPAPFERWMRDKRYSKSIRQYVEKFINRGIVNGEYLMWLYDEEMEGRWSDPDFFFRIMMLEMWLEKEIDTPNYYWVFPEMMEIS